VRHDLLQDQRGNRLPMIWHATLDGVGAVELFKQDDEREFVLEGEGGEGPDGLAFLTKGGSVAIGGPNEE
jgi:hypothetical protein